MNCIENAVDHTSRSRLLVLKLERSSPHLFGNELKQNKKKSEFFLLLLVLSKDLSVFSLLFVVLSRHSYPIENKWRPLADGVT